MTGTPETATGEAALTVDELKEMINQLPEGTILRIIPVPGDETGAYAINGESNE